MTSLLETGIHIQRLSFLVTPAPVVGIKIGLIGTGELIKVSSRMAS